MQFLHQLRAIRDVNNSLLSEEPPVQATRVIPRCPGLNRVSNDGYRWTVSGGENDATFCEQCSSELNLTGEQRKLKRCNCDSYRRKNKADNGVLNISFWEPSLHTFYETMPITDSQEEASIPTYYVKIPSGEKFCMLLQSHLKENQVFRYEIEFTTLGSSESRTLAPESKIHIHDSVFVGSSSKRSHFGYVDSQNPGWVLMDSEDRVMQYKIIKPGDSMTIKVHIYNIVTQDLTLKSGQYLGSYTLKSDNTIQPKYSQRAANYEQRYYDNKYHMCVPSRDFELFTTTPMQMKFIFITDTEQEDKSDALLSTALKRMIKNMTGKVQQLNADMMVQLKKESAAYEARTELKKQFSETSERLDQIRKVISDPVDTEPGL